MKAGLLRNKFLDFFQAKKHKIVESDSLVPKNDSTVLFTPAGMNQFKRQFLGHLTGFSRAASSQRCLRTDDLDKVGKTPFHHTFFEMLGNFSFGDYFKEEAIAWAWDFLTKELQISKDKLWVSIYKDDTEAYKVWKDRIRVPDGKIIRLGDKENFWPSEAKAKGPNGPCGPCSEIFFDQGNIVPGCGKSDCSPACGCGRFVEVWNLVFTQFNRKEDGRLEPLPKKNIDTGMGLERLTAVIQEKQNNFETDLFQPLVKEIRTHIEKTLRKEYENELVYAIADHIRAITFAIYDGVVPSNEERGYVVRKLIRKSIKDLRALGIKKPFLYKLVPILAQVMKAPYPELEKRRENISEIILAEEKNFIAILDSSNELLNKGLSELVKKTEDKTFSEKDIRKASIIAFEFYDTYGIPWKLTKDWADVHGIKLDKEIFDSEMEKQRLRSKSGSAMKGDVFNAQELHLAGAKTSFSGYAKCETKAKITRMIKDSVVVKKISVGEEVVIILDKTVFYPESGGQVGDTGEFIKGKNIFQVTDTQKFDKVILHKGRVKSGSFKTGDELKSRVDTRRRLSIARNHTATHLLQAALRKVLGAHVQQQGSLVAEDRLRFDFTHFKDVTREQLDRIEEVVNSYIINNEGLKAKTLTLAEAKKQGALAFFAEKYAEKVRMVAIGDFSKELCAGTHLESTGQVGLFKIISEGAVASGIRRIEAVTGDRAYKIVREQENILKQISSTLNVPAQKATQELQKRLSQLKELEKKINYQKTDILRASIDDYLKEKEVINGINVITRFIAGEDMDGLRKAVDLIKDKEKNVIVALGTTTASGQALLVTGTNLNTQTQDLDIARLTKEVAPEIGGSGGGRKDFAQAGGNKPENFPQAFNKLKEMIRQLK